MLIYSFTLGVLLHTASGDGFATCIWGSSCAAWKAVLDSPGTKVSIRDKMKGKYYLVTLTPGNNAASWTIFRRYTDFHIFREQLGDEVVELAEFPPKLYFESVKAMFGSRGSEKRRAALELWLQTVLKSKHSKGQWTNDLFIFLDAKRADLVTKSGIDMPPDADRVCGVYSNRVHYFGIDVRVSADKVERIYHRHKEFHDFNTTLAELGATQDDFEVALPPKIYWNAFVNMWESKVEERRRSLEAWLQQVKIHPRCGEGGPWAQALRRFLDPEANKKAMKNNCLVEDVAKNTYGRLATNTAHEQYEL